MTPNLIKGNNNANKTTDLKEIQPRAGEARSFTHIGKQGVRQKHDSRSPKSNSARGKTSSNKSREMSSGKNAKKRCGTQLS